MANQYLSNVENMADLVSNMKAEDRQDYTDFSHIRIEAVFDSRLLIVFKPCGTAAKQPEILTTIKVLDFACTSIEGASIEVEDLGSSQRQVVTTVPARLFGYNLFMSVPPELRLRWDVREVGAGRRVRSLCYAALIKSKNRSDTFSPGVTYIETPNRFREFFPSYPLQLTHY